MKQEKIVHDRPPMLAIGVMIWLGSELMFFSGLFAALFTIRARLQPWPPAGTKLDVLQAGIFPVARTFGIHAGDQHVLLVESHVDVRQVDQTAQEQARAGEHTGQGVKAFRKRAPSAASRSSCGVNSQGWSRLLAICRLF